FSRIQSARRVAVPRHPNPRGSVAGSLCPAASRSRREVSLMSHTLPLTPLTPSAHFTAPSRLASRASSHHAVAPFTLAATGFPTYPTASRLPLVPSPASPPKDSDEPTPAAAP